jgi:hypothetical protein
MDNEGNAFAVVKTMAGWRNAEVLKKLRASKEQIPLS